MPRECSICGALKFPGHRCRKEVLEAHIAIIRRDRESLASLPPTGLPEDDMGLKMGMELASKVEAKLATLVSVWYGGCE